MIKISFIFLMVLCSSTLHAMVEVPALFSDGMVIQRNQEVPVWGWAEAGLNVDVTLGKAMAQGKVSTEGKWMVRLPPMEASAQNREMTIKVGNESKVIKDVLVGEVWLCGGQSNMDFTLQALSRKTKDPQHQILADTIAKEIKTANDHLFRQISVPRNASANTLETNFKGNWILSSPQSNGHFTGTGYFFGRELRNNLKVPVGLIKCPWGGTLVEPWIPRHGFEFAGGETKSYFDQSNVVLADKMKKWDPDKADAQFKKRLSQWKEDVKKAKETKAKPPRRPRKPSRPDKNRRHPSALFNAMIHPLIPYGVKGAIWYQGESNRSHHPKEYSLRFSSLIHSWRDLWAQGDFPFYFCQLAQFQSPPNEPLDQDGWVEICDQQRRTLVLPNTGMAVLNDIGEAKDIHPRNKMEAGRRLSLWALAKDYAVNLPAYSGPLYRDHMIKGNKIIISFDHVGSGLMVGHKPVMGPTVEVDEPLKRFQIRSKEGEWMWASGNIVAKDQVEVWNEAITLPDAVRYAWAANPEGSNLYNREGLPASLFKTDD